MNFGIIGTNFISDWFANAGRHCEGFCVQAVYSRTMEKGRTFADKHGIPDCYDSLEALASADNVDAVYIASPTACHAAQSIQMLNAGKHVLCEKPVASNEKELQAMLAAAKEHGVVFMEAMKLVINPAFDAIMENLPKLGKIRRVTFQMCQYSSRYDSFKEGKEHNIFRRECSAGALMDIGVYSVHMMLQLLGKPEAVRGFSVMLHGDIDGAGTILAKYEDKIAEVSYSKITNSALPNELQGENGVMQFHGSANSPENVKIIFRDGKEEVFYHRETENDMKYELEHFLRMIHGEESSEIHVQRSLDGLELMDEVRRQCGIVFPADE